MKKIVLAIATSALAACSAGGGSQSLVPNGGHTPLDKTQARIIVDVPSANTSAARRPAYISPNTKSLTVAQGGGAPTTIALTPTSPGCSTGSGGYVVCAVNINASPGKAQNFVFTTYASSTGTGSPLSTATVTADINVGVVNPITVTLNGVIASMKVVVTPNSAPSGSASTASVGIQAQDASGATIVGPGNYTSPVTLSDGDTSGATHLSGTTISAPGQTVTLSYNGSSSFSSATITASANGVQSANSTPGTFTTHPASGTIQEFAIPVGSTPASPLGIVSGSDGNLWVTEYGTGYIDKVNPSSGAITQIKPSFASLPCGCAVSQPQKIVSGPGGKLYAADYSNGFEIITTAGAVSWADPNNGNAFGIASASDGNVYEDVLDSSGNVNLDVLKSDGTTAVAGSNSTLTPNSLGQMVQGPDGNLWFSTNTGDLVKATLYPSSSFTTYALPGSAGGDITVGPDNNLWLTATSAPCCYYRATTGGASTAVAGNGSAAAMGIISGPRGHLWATVSDNTIVEMDTNGNVIKTYAIPTANANPGYLTVGPDGNVWFTEQDANKIGRLFP